MKRIFDIASALLGLIFFVPLFLIISLLIKLDDNGPVFFRQIRVGRGGRLFSLYKFRTMSVSIPGEEDIFEPGNTSRITSLGKFLRKTKIDELPQLYNVLIGDMSLVGPRPEIKKWVDIYPDRWERILTLRPGMTDYASIIYRQEEKILAESQDPVITYKEVILPHKLEYYEKYILNHSFLGDLELIFKTLLYVANMKKKNHENSILEGTLRGK